MSNSVDRKVKSLNDIPEVFKRRDPDEAKIRRVSSTIVWTREDETKNVFFDCQDYVDIFFTIGKNIDEENDSKSFHASKEDVENHLLCNSKKDPSAALAEQKDTSESRGKQWKTVKRVLSVIDVFLSLIIITPLTISFWRGTWTLMDIHADLFPGLFTVTLGILVHTSFAILKNLLHNRLIDASRKKACANRTLCKSTQILYTYVFGVACNMQWRGGWIIFDYFFLDHTWASTAVTALSILTLMIFRSVRNLISIPSVVAVDKLAYVFRFPTRYKLNTRDWSLYLLDCAFSVGVVGTLVVFVWRGVWILFDLYLFPEDRECSALGSLAIGYAIVTVTFSLQPLMRYVCARLQGLARLVVADGFLLLSFLGTVNVWRGIWYVLDLWLLPDNPELSCWITHVGCFVFLVLLNCSNSILVRGVYIDAEEDDGKCVVFPCHYLRLFFKVEREKKEARRRNLLVASKDFRPRPDGNAKDTENGALLPNSAVTTILPTNPESLV